MNKATQAYLQTKVSTTDQGQLLLLLYDGALRFLQQAREKILLKDYAAKGMLISRVIDIINELSSTLNLEKGGTLADNLNNLYFLCTTRLLQANLKMNVEQLDSVTAILSGLRSAYAEIIVTPEAQKISAQISARLNAQSSMAQRPVQMPQPIGNPLSNHLGQAKARTMYGQVQSNAPQQVTAPQTAIQQAPQQSGQAQVAQTQVAQTQAQAAQAQITQAQAAQAPPTQARMRAVQRPAARQTLQQAAQQVQQMVAQQAARTAQTTQSPKAMVTFPEKSSPKTKVTQAQTVQPQTAQPQAAQPQAAQVNKARVVFPEDTAPKPPVSTITHFGKTKTPQATPTRNAGLAASVRMPTLATKAQSQNTAATPPPKATQAVPQNMPQELSPQAQVTEPSTTQNTAQETQSTPQTKTQNPPAKGFGLANFKHLNIYGK